MTNPFFKPIPGSAVVLYSRGVYRQVECAVREGEPYAKWGPGYIRMLASGITSMAHVTWRDYDLPADFRVINNGTKLFVDNAYKPMQVVGETRKP